MLTKSLRVHRKSNANKKANANKNLAQPQKSKQTINTVLSNQKRLFVVF
jgi:hypothetical protein